MAGGEHEPVAVRATRDATGRGAARGRRAPRRSRRSRAANRGGRSGTRGRRRSRGLGRWWLRWRVFLWGACSSTGEAITNRTGATAALALTFAGLPCCSALRGRPLEGLTRSVRGGTEEARERLGADRDRHLLEQRTHPSLVHEGIEKRALLDRPARRPAALPPRRKPVRENVREPGRRAATDVDARRGERLQREVACLGA